MKRRRVVKPRRVRVRRHRSRVVRLRRRLARHAASLRSRQSTTHRVVLALALLVMVLIPLPVLASDTHPKPPACTGSVCQTQRLYPQRWLAKLPGTWAAGTRPEMIGDGGTVPANGQAAYVAAGGGLAVVGTGLSLTAYTLDRGKERWQTTLTGPLGTVIVSVRAWQGVITAGLLAPGGHARTEVVVNAVTGVEMRHYPAAVFGGAVAASAATTVVIGGATVTSYNNATGRVRWQHAITSGQSWQADGETLYVAEASGGDVSSSPVTALKVINMEDGTEHILSSPLDEPFSGTLAMAADGSVLFASPTKVTAYSGSTGGELWDKDGAVPEGTDPATKEIDLTAANGTLVGVDPQTGNVRASLPAATATGAAAVYVVRDGVALGLDSGANGAAWGYDMAKGRVTWTSPALPWPHFYSDVSGLGGSAAASGDLVVVTACMHLAASPGICADPRLVAFKV
ncbi:MAG TPA: PQQ-binding-like beta-propeller repeat protein [Trebonia sp.]|nr:PQQ-binding-like beta-propeller repeat protein [Trebonia sp.]